MKRLTLVAEGNDIDQVMDIVAEAADQSLFVEPSGENETAETPLGRLSWRWEDPTAAEDGELPPLPQDTATTLTVVGIVDDAHLAAVIDAVNALAYVSDVRANGAAA